MTISDKINQLILEEKPFFHDGRNQFSLGLSIIINIIHWIILLFKLHTMQSTILLSYNVFYENNFLASSKYAYLIPGAALVFFIFNAFLSNYYYSRERSVAYFLNFSTIIIQALFLVVSIIIITTNV
jgi:hypothetical protein